MQRPPVALATGRLTRADLGLKALEREKLAMAAPCSTSPASISFLCITPASLGLEQNPGNHFDKHTTGGAVCADAPNPNHDVPAHVRSSGLRLDPLCLRSAPLSFPHSLGFARSPNSFACQPCPPGQMPGSGSSDSACPRLRSS